MKYFILDATAQKTEARFRGLAGKYIAWQVAELGGAVVERASQADVILATIVAPHEWECLPRALKRVGVSPLPGDRAQLVILGGQGAMAPKIFERYIDLACIGEGQSFLRALVGEGFAAAAALPNAWRPGQVEQAIPDQQFPWDAPPTMAEDGIVRIYASRGCKKKCLFCQTGWQMPYQETVDQRLAQQVDRLKASGYRVAVVTNDAPALSFFSTLDMDEHFSASYSQTLEILEKGAGAFPKVKTVRFGVEAPSSRLRAPVGKPIVTEDLFRVTCELLNQGIGVRWFMIAGLPGERDEDYDDLKRVVVEARHKITKGALQLSFTAFCPDPAAPLCLLPLVDDYWPRYRAFQEWFFGGEGFTRKIQIFKPAAPAARMRHAMGAMAATEAELRHGWLDKDPPNWQAVRYHLEDRARRACAVYAARVGIGSAR